MSKDAANSIREYFKNQKASTHAILGHPLQQCSKGAKLAYMEMLCSIMTYANEPTEEQVFFIKRLMAGVENEYDLETHLEMACELEDEMVECFIEEVKEEALQNNFVVDALILSAITGNPKREQLTYISEICEVLELQEKEVAFLSQLAVSILEQDSEKYMALLKEVPARCKLEKFTCYTEAFVTGLLMDDSKSIYYYAVEKADFNDFIDKMDEKEETVVYKQEEVKFVNWKIDLSKLKWHFKNNKEVSFINCEFIGKTNCMFFEGSNCIEYRNCKFKGFENRVFRAVGCIEVDIMNCQFEECIYIAESSASSRYGGVYQIYEKGTTTSKDERKVMIQDCTFKECGMWHKRGSNYMDYIIGESSIRQYVSNTAFYNCLGYDTGSKYETASKYMFNNLTLKDCVRTNSGNL